MAERRLQVAQRGYASPGASSMRTVTTQTGLYESVWSGTATDVVDEAIARQRQSYRLRLNEHGSARLRRRAREAVLRVDADVTPDERQRNLEALNQLPRNDADADVVVLSRTRKSLRGR